MTDKTNSAPNSSAPNSSAVRVALWRAIHVQYDSPPHVLSDEIGLKLASPDPGWRDRPDMQPDGTRYFRASIVARARYIEDFVESQVGNGVRQYVILGAGLDSFAQRKPEVASRLRLFEVDEFRTQRWKQRRLVELGYGIPEWLRFVPVDFESGDDWLSRLADAGFATSEPAIVASTGVSMYLTNEAVFESLKAIASYASGSTLIMSFLLPLDFAEPELRPAMQRAVDGAKASGTPFLSFFTPSEIMTLARDAGFREVRHVSAAALTQRYFSNRTDGLRLPLNSEELLIAST